MEWDHKRQWERCASFHGHVCGGLLIGYLAALYAAELLDLAPAEGEEAVCIAENDACGVDAIQAALGCSVGKGNLLFHMTGKQAFSFYNRADGQSVRLVLAERPEPLEGRDIEAYCRAYPPEGVFRTGPVRLPLPERARRFESYACEGCGETAGANWIRIQDGKKLCMDCARHYDRFRV